MQIPRARLRQAALLTGMAVLTQTVPAQAAGPGAAYRLSMAPQSGAAVVRTLSCEPAGGTHEEAEAACAQLGSVHGQVGRIAERPGPCTMEYAPVRVRADGRWHGAPRHFARTYENRCVAVRATGGILFR